MDIKKKWKAIQRLFTDSTYRIGWLNEHGFFKNMTDDKYLVMRYKSIFNKKLDLKEPHTFNEKLQWLKLYDRKPEYTRMVDKHEAKTYVAERIGEEYIIPTLGVWDKFEDIDFTVLPNQFVLKCTHDSGGLVICRDKSKLDMERSKDKITRSLKRDYYMQSREWPYKNVKPRIIAEQYMQDGASPDLPVYKFFCFDGEPKIIQVIQNDKQVNESIDYFDIQWNLLDMRQNFPNSKKPLERPKNLEKMLDLVRRLAKDKKSFLRVDLYEINGRIYFSEYTFFSDAGMAKFDPEKWDEILGEWTILPEMSGGIPDFK